MPDDGDRDGGYRDKEPSRIDTLPPPASGDAYSAETVVRKVAPELLAVSKGAPRPQAPKVKKDPPVRKPRPPAPEGIPKVSDDPADDDEETQLQSVTPQVLQARSAVGSADAVAPVAPESVVGEEPPSSPPGVDADGDPKAADAAVVVDAPLRARPGKGWFDLELLMVFVVAMAAVVFVGLIAMDLLGNR